MVKKRRDTAGRRVPQSVERESWYPSRPVSVAPRLGRGAGYKRRDEGYPSLKVEGVVLPLYR
ncbi:hypothetical protein PERCYII40_6251 [Pseudomonas aeruginosa]|nr:hypothetical protein PERCYII40_6251 [Pseudomonas aeruginosa]